MKDLDYEGADACLLVYCIDKESTFDAIEEFRSDCKSHAERCKFILVGNKVDLDAHGMRQVSTGSGKAYKQENDLDYFCETNAHAQDHIMGLFTEMKNILMEAHHKNMRPNTHTK